MISRAKRRRHGKVLVLLAVSLPVLLGIIGFVVDGGFMASNQRRLQQATDAAATEAATFVMQGGSAAQAIALAENCIRVRNELPTAIVSVHTPPTSGNYAGQAGFVHVQASLPSRVSFMHVLDGVLSRNVSASSVAAAMDATDGAAIVVLDAEPASLSLSGLNQLLSTWNVTSLVNQVGLSGALGGVGQLGLLNGITNSLVNLLSNLLNNVGSQIDLPAAPSLLGGMEVEGVGRLIVDGAIIVNTKWGGWDENGVACGIAAGPPYALSCMPLLPTTLVRANDIRVVGGVDEPDYYQSTTSGHPTPLRANCLPTPDPLRTLPPPSTSIDPSNVSSVVRGGHVVRINVLSVGSIVQPLLGFLWPILRPVLEPVLTPLFVTTPLNPGVYDSITVLSLGEVRFNPGVYIIRGKSPITGISLSIVGGRITADDVMFYVTNSSAYSAVNGSPDSGDDPDATAPINLGTILPSVLLAPLLGGSSLSGINDAGSPFDGMFLYQRRLDPRPIVIAAPQLLGSDLSGAIYTKGGHLSFLAGQGTYDLRLVCGTLRIITLGDTVLSPQDLLAPAKDVFLVE